MTIEGGHLLPRVSVALRCEPPILTVAQCTLTSRDSLWPQRIDGSARRWLARWEGIAFHQRDGAVIAFHKCRAALHPVTAVVVCDLAELPNGGAMDVAA